MIRGVKMQSEKKKAAISYWSKEKCTCPVCKRQFDKEVMLSGNGRMIALWTHLSAYLRNRRLSELLFGVFVERF